jgi:hypothetical protein
MTRETKQIAATIYIISVWMCTDFNFLQTCEVFLKAEELLASQEELVSMASVTLYTPGKYDW